MCNDETHLITPKWGVVMWMHLWYCQKKKKDHDYDMMRMPYVPKNVCNNFLNFISM